jgi:hypothetical protein
MFTVGKKDTNRKYYASLCHAQATAQAKRLKKKFLWYLIYSSDNHFNKLCLTSIDMEKPRQYPKCCKDDTRKLNSILNIFYKHMYMIWILHNWTYCKIIANFHSRKQWMVVAVLSMVLSSGSRSRDLEPYYKFLDQALRNIQTNRKYYASLSHAQAMAQAET